MLSDHSASNPRDALGGFAGPVREHPQSGELQLGLKYRKLRFDSLINRGYEFTR